MKFIFTILIATAAWSAAAQNPVPAIPKPAGPPAPQPGTPMVSDPVANNNPSVQASIPINKPNSLEQDKAKGTLPEPPRIINNNAQQNTPAKNQATEGRNNPPAVPVINPPLPDTPITRFDNIATDFGAVLQTNVIYNNANGTDITAVNEKSTTVTKKNGNTQTIQSSENAAIIVNRYKTQYSSNLYDITMIRTDKNKSYYVIRIMQNGGFITSYLDENGVWLR